MIMSRAIVAGLSVGLVACGPVPGGWGEVEAPIAYETAPAPTAEAPPSGARITVELFYEALAPYGTWEQRDPWGKVWTPSDPDFVPYTQGSWAYTESWGLTWVPDTEWGWATEHYGRWMQDGDEWCWAPDTVWGPGWVDFRDADAYVGWTPLPPPDYDPAYAAWVYVDVSSLFVEHVYTCFLPAADVAWVHRRAHRVAWVTGPGTTWCPGPSRRSLRD